MIDIYVFILVDKFAFGFWMVGYQGRDPFGDVVCFWIDFVDLVKCFGELGVWGVFYYDDDLFVFGEGNGQCIQRIVNFRVVFDELGVVCSMVTINLFFYLVFRDGAFMVNDRDVCCFVICKVMDNFDVVVELGVWMYVCWGGREGTDIDVAKDFWIAFDWYKEVFDILGQYVLEQGYDICFVFEFKFNEFWGDIFLFMIGYVMVFIEWLEHFELVGLNFEVGYEHMSNLNFYYGVVQVLWQGKLYYIDFNVQKGPRFDQDICFGVEVQKEMMFFVGLLERGGYEGFCYFDCWVYCIEDMDGVWDFVCGCMRNYLILKEKVVVYVVDFEVQVVQVAVWLFELVVFMWGVGESLVDLRAGFVGFDVDVCGVVGVGYDWFDQLVVEHFFGVRG